MNDWTILYAATGLRAIAGSARAIMREADERQETAFATGCRRWLPRRSSCCSPRLATAFMRAIEARLSVPDDLRPVDSGCRTMSGAVMNARRIPIWSALRFYCFCSGRVQRLGLR